MNLLVLNYLIYANITEATLLQTIWIQQMNVPNPYASGMIFMKH